MKCYQKTLIFRNDKNAYFRPAKLETGGIRNFAEALALVPIVPLIRGFTGL